ncbi:MAG TPA: hypothetical protein VMA77_12920 [Solirubrobacteraceae bacterium]|nr:hypothetical protein [Solirubrobacteraceae bacterium]
MDGGPRAPRVPVAVEASACGAASASAVVSDGLAIEAESLAGAPVDDVVAPVALWLVAAMALVESEPATSCGVLFCDESVSVTVPVGVSAALSEMEPELPAGELAPVADAVAATGSARTAVAALATARAGATTGDSGVIVSLASVCGAPMLPSALWRSWTAEEAISESVGADCSESGALAESTPSTGWGAAEAAAGAPLP